MSPSTARGRSRQSRDEARVSRPPLALRGGDAHCPCHGRQVTESEAARSEAEGQREGDERRTGEGEARELQPSRVPGPQGQEVAAKRIIRRRSRVLAAVSYTHLTLPTSDLV